MAEAARFWAWGRGASHPGRIRPKNEDRYLIDDDFGLYAVFDGMGGHSAGDVAAALARDVIVRYVAERRHKRDPRKLLERAFQRASAAVHREAQRRRERYGMGTTAVALLVSSEGRAVLASVGDSRAYLVRGGRLRLLTRDQTIVSELVAAGSLSPEAAESHPYRSVLSNNLGARPRTHVQLSEFALEAGDRLLLCSDGLTGFAPPTSIAEIAAGASDAERAAEDLVELALEGGGGDNVTALVVEAAPQFAARSTAEIRRIAADAWWQKRDRFLELATARGLARLPICASVPEDEAVELVGGNWADALARDLEQKGTEHVDVFAEKLASGWMDQGGDLRAIQDLFDCLRRAACDVAADLRAERDPYAEAVEAGAYRSLAIAEAAVGRLLARQLRRLERSIDEAQQLREARALEQSTLSGQPTLPDASSAPADPPDPDVIACLESALTTARGELGEGAERAVLAGVHDLAASEASGVACRSLAWELCGDKMLDETGAVALFAALDRAREAHLSAVRRVPAAPPARAAAMQRAARAHEGVATALGALAFDEGRSISDDLAASSEHARSLHAQVLQAEQRLTKLEEALAALSGQPIDTIVSDGGGA